ncbi:lysophospholipase, partial [Phakopsora pachyrhizi]
YLQGQVPISTASSYAPVVQACPTDQPLIRLAGAAVSSNQSLSTGEINFRNGRRNFTSSNWKEFFTTGPGSKTNYQSTSLLSNENNDWPILGLAHSGGGERAALYAAGVVKALDARTTESPVRGILQLATYQSGLSGGSWTVMSLATNDFSTVDQMVTGWQLEKDLLNPGLKISENFRYYSNVLRDKKLKEDSNFKTSITDIWGRALSHYFLPGSTNENFFEGSSKTSHGAGILFSALTESRGFTEFQSPYPIIVSNNQGPISSNKNESQLPIQGKTVIPLSNTVYEFTPLEFGSFDPSLSAFTPTKYLGTRLNSGKPVDTSPTACVTAFDQASFIMATSASLFNEILPETVGAIQDFGFSQLLNKIVSIVNNNEKVKSATIADYPNPFKGVNGPSGFESSTVNDLGLADGSENGENIPLNPLLAPARSLDVIIAADASADTVSSDQHGANWPNGASMVNTFIRVTQVLPKGSASFPEVPLDPKEWISKGFNTRPTFFGCNALTTEGNGGLPLVIYIPNTPLPQSEFNTNTSTFKLQVSIN